VGIPRLAGFRFDVGKPHAGRRIGDANQVLAGGALNLPAGELGFALQRLVAVGTVEFEFVGVHSLWLNKRNRRKKNMPKFHPYFLPTESAWFGIWMIRIPE
jgi:hypothetical protein